VSGWHDDESVTVSPALLYITVRDSLVFACALPLAELVEWGQKDGWNPTSRSCRSDNPRPGMIVERIQDCRVDDNFKAQPFDDRQRPSSST
jgi:hypothetical protein